MKYHAWLVTVVGLVCLGPGLGETVGRSETRRLSRPQREQFTHRALAGTRNVTGNDGNLNIGKSFREKLKTVPIFVNTDAEGDILHVAQSLRQRSMSVQRLRSEHEVWHTAVDATDGALERPRRSAPDPVNECGGWINDTRGTIQTPKFPGQFPVPLYCRWVFYAPDGNRVVLYFTQVYLRQFFHVAEYDSYTNETTFEGRVELEEIRFQHEVMSLFGIKRYLVITLGVSDLHGNMHVRTSPLLEHDVYGFNITYEVVPDGAPNRTDTCSVVYCSDLGHCLVSADYEQFQCHCFPGYYGQQCQYGEFCDPQKGVNYCQNGGKCRYVMGSYINVCECPPGYGGSQCQVKDEQYVHPECREMGCSQTCSTGGEGGTLVCACWKWYKLAPDNRTCVEKEQMRYHVTMRLIADPQAMGGDFNCSEVHVHGELTELVDLALGDIEHDNMSIISVTEERPYLYVDYRFMGQGTDVADVSFWLQIMVYAQSLCGLKADPDFLMVDVQPGLKLTSLSNYDNGPVPEGEVMTLMCSARGPPQMYFQWIKDGALLDIRRTTRNIWAENLPTYQNHTYMSVLNIEQAHYLDAGEYTCAVADLDQVESRSLHVDVTPRPRMEVAPMAVTTPPGTKASILCLSRDDEHARFQYTWERNGEPLVPGVNGEVIEALFPTGSRLQLRNIRQSTVYTCTVSNAAGVNKEHSIIAVIDGDGPMCEPDVSKAVKWQRTKANQMDVQACPRDAEGKATRKCECHGGECTWDEPNFAKCTSIPLDVITQKFQTLELGFQASRVGDSLRSLLRMMQEQHTYRGHILAGDLGRVAQLTVDMQQYIHMFEQPADKTILYQELFQIEDLMLMNLSMATHEEITDLNITAHVMELVENMRGDVDVLAGIGEATSQAIDIQIDKPRCVRGENVTFYKSSSVEAWITATGDLCQSDFKKYAVTYPGSIDVMDIGIEGYARTGELVYFALHSSTSEVGLQALGFFIKYHHIKPLHESQVNRTICSVWNHGQDIDPHWTTTGCSPVESEVSHTVCHCLLPGHYTAFTARGPLVTQLSVHSRNIHILPLLFLVLGLTGFVLSLAIQILLWRKYPLDDRFVSVSFTLCLIGVCGLLIRRSSAADSGVLCIMAHLMMEFFLLLALCSALAEIVSITVNADSSVAPRPGHQHPSLTTVLTYTSLAIGFPVTLIAGLVIYGHVRGFNSRTTMCRLSFRDWEFYTLIVPIASIVVCYIVALGVCLYRRKLCKLDISNKQMRFRYKLTIFRSVTNVTLLCCIISLYVLLNYRGSAASFISLAIIVMLMGLFSVVTAHPVILFRITVKFIKPKGVKIANTVSESSFKAFMKPQYSISSSVEADLENILRQDKIKMSKEERARLWAMLGQSSTDSSGGSVGTRASALSAFLDNSVLRRVSDAEDIDDDDDEGEEDGNGTITTMTTNLSLNLSRTKLRHSANSKCLCSGCGTAYPFKPAKGRAFILSDGESSGLRCNSSFGGTASGSGSGPKCEMRRIVSVPTAENTTVNGAIPGGGEDSDTSIIKNGNKRNKRKSSTNSRVTFQLGSGGSEQSLSAAGPVTGDSAPEAGDASYMEMRDWGAESPTTTGPHVVNSYVLTGPTRGDTSRQELDNDSVFYCSNAETCT